MVLHLLPDFHLLSVLAGNRLSPQTWPLPIHSTLLTLSGAALSEWASLPSTYSADEENKAQVEAEA